MKIKVLKFLALIMTSVTLTVSTKGQNRENIATETIKNKPVEIPKTEIPIDVAQHFAKDHPTAKEEHWRGYPTKNFRDVWYDQVPSENSSPTSDYFVVEFIEGTTHREAMYCREGKEVVIRKKLMSTLPAPIYDDIKKGPYKEWKIAKEKEEIFRDSVLDQFKVYKIKVQKGSSKHYLFYSADGVLLKDKIIQ